MAETAERARLAQLESLGDATQFAGRIQSLMTFSPLFENFNLAEIRVLSQFMQAYGTEPGVEIIREGEAGGCLGVFIEGRIEGGQRGRWNGAALTARVAAGRGLGAESTFACGPPCASCCGAVPHR